jgi:hypothetical protein
MTPEQAMAAARAVVKYDDWAPAEVVGVLLAELDARGVAIERVRELHQDERAGAIPRRCFICGEAVPCTTTRALDGRP